MAAPRKDPALCRRVVITPIYNEMPAIAQVLPRIAAEADLVIAVDDGSTDGTPGYLAHWAKHNPNAILITSRRNRGASVALRKGYVLVAHLLKMGHLDPDDCVIEIDSDGQHDPKYIGALCDRFLSFRGAIDVVLARRDFSVYPRHKIFGNWALTMAASVMGRFRYHDVESNFRVLRASVFPELLRWFSGYRYSGAFEVGIILGDLGYRIDNAYVIRVPLYRHGASASDGLSVLAMGVRAWLWRRLRRTSRDVEPFTTEAIAETSFPEWYTNSVVGEESR